MAKQKPATKVCKHCSTEIPYEAKICPNCRKKVKGGKLKWILLVIVAIGVLGAVFGGGNDKGSNDTASVETQNESVDNAGNTEAAKKKAPEAKTEEKKIEYNTYDCTELFDDLSGNALKAEKTHQDEYVIIKGYVSTIDSDGKYISIGAAEDNYDYMFQTIQCNIKSEDQVSAVEEMQKGDEVTIKGKIKDIGEIIGYHVDIIEIQ